MTKTEAIAICEAWFAHNERQRVKAVEIQGLAKMAREGRGEEARRRLAQIDRAPNVYDASKLEDAVATLVELIRDA